MYTKPIGIFDSGVGGLSILKCIRQLLPNEDIIYVADSGYAPYGCKGEAYIEQRSKYITEFLLEQGAKTIVIACNTATASIIEKFRTSYGIPFIGVEPGIKPAVECSINGKIGVLATTGTLSSSRYSVLCHRYGQKVHLHNRACPGLADQVESGLIDTPETIRLLNTYIEPLLKKKVDTLVLGCTHYSFLSELIRQIIGESIFLIDTSFAVAEQAYRILVHQNLRKLPLDHSSDDISDPVFQKTNISFYTTGSIESTQFVMSHLLKQEIMVDKISC